MGGETSTGDGAEERAEERAETGRTDEVVRNDGPDVDADVAVVGGGPAGCSAAVFAARYGLDTVVFDRGRSSIRQCGYLENYLGFPGGVDVDAFYDLMHAHLEEAGGTLVPELVESVDRIASDAADGRRAGTFRVETQDGTSLRASRVVAATKYDAGYLAGVDEAMFVDDGHGGETLDPDYPSEDGATPVGGLYVAGPLAGVPDQAVVAAGHGGRVGGRVVADVRRENGHWDAVATYYDWVRRDATLTDEWRDRDRWREYFDEYLAPEGEAAETLDEAHVERVRESYIDERFAKYATDEEIARRTDAGTERLVETVGVDRLLDAVDDDRIRAYLDD
ncbi:NAD(P)/FAD-dependent oxidoreductase [Halogeometricum luteum]|uniref:NAD(P)/FAD-dependent oxidoreductase n=1 Tax=Halogeometricum luteum TaxID=2950537 RepID=A0ABU2G481_9EURY|nr:NAD(P)/FAD-dependent oxidoreductase [Halogeometricum sp. S3BR5-2]MDS0295590.1 NAD(P)/FAD-dependent oxidoreductase [Halogeometricum sp. S3BR5-2]